jgi:hypothetical protein
MEAHAAEWNRGGVCRNASAKVAIMAERRGDLVRLPMFETTDPSEGHVMPIVRHRGEWFAIDSVLEGDEYFPSYLRLDSYSPSRDVKIYASVSGRDLTLYLGDASHNDVDCWKNEGDCKQLRLMRINAAMDEISRMKRSLEIGEGVIKVFTKQFPNLWNHYQQRISDMEIAKPLE